jgi:hypothetical protein
LVNAQKFSRIVICLAFTILIIYGAHWCTTQASYSLIAWDTGLGIKLPHYDSVIDADNTLYFSQFQWDTVDASKVTFSSVRMGTGSPISSFGVSSDVNMTFNSVANDKVSYLVDDVGSQNFTGVTEPDSVKIDGVLSSSGWSFSGNILHVNGATTSVEVLFAPDDTAGIAVIGFALGVIAVALAIVFGVMRRKKDDD